MIPDISHNNTPLPGDFFHACKAQGAEGVTLKVSEGTTFVDPMWAIWRPQVESVFQELFCAYHFATSADDGVAQANHFLKTLGNRSDVRYLAVDLESSSQSNWKAVDASTRVARLFHLLATLVNTGHKILLYCSPSYWTELFLPYLSESQKSWLAANVGLWEAEYGVAVPKAMSPWVNPTLWQYTESGSIGGASGIDLSRIV